jgi:sulfite reductase alpha subunit-like flavoprotein
MTLCRCNLRLTCVVDSICLSYEPGDVAVIHPETPEADVESFLSSMGWENVADDSLAIESQFPGEMQ